MSAEKKQETTKTMLKATEYNPKLKYKLVSNYNYQDVILKANERAIAGDNEKYTKAIQKALQEAINKASGKMKSKHTYNMLKANRLSKNHCVVGYMKANNNCDAALNAPTTGSADIANDFDKRYITKRNTYFACLSKSKVEFDKCSQKQRCNKRLSEAKQKCDKSFNMSANTPVNEMEKTYPGLTKCFPEALKTHQSCKKQSNKYEEERAKCEKNMNMMANRLTY